MKKRLPLKEYIKNQFYPLCVRLGFLILLYSFFRLVFLIANSSNFTNVITSLFFHGIRFDLVAIVYSNLPYIIAVLLPISLYYNKIYRKIFDLYFIIVNSFAAIVTYIDVAYYPYVFKRITFDTFSYIQTGFDFQSLLPLFLKHFWYLLLLFIATVCAIILLAGLTNKMIVSKPHFRGFLWKDMLGKTCIIVLCAAGLVVGMRGGIQLRPLGPIDAGKFTSLQNTALVSNTPFTLMKSFGKNQNIEKHYFQNLEEAESFYSPIINQITPYSQHAYPVKNVIIIVLESFSRYLIEDMKVDTNNVEYPAYCPFLHSLKNHSISFNGIANGHCTIEALPAIFSGHPKLLNTSIVETVFAGSLLYSPVEVLRKRGFNTLFFHGAKNGSMNIESYCYSAGFTQYFGKNEYPNPADYDGCWGISDRSYLQYVAQKLNSAKQPFFAGILTLSSHHPFNVPKDAEGLDLIHGTHPIHTVASYTDHAVREFFETISQYSWYDSTLFVITSDHVSSGSLPSPRSIYTTLQIPLFFYHPKANIQKSMGNIQQLDIMPTIFSYLNIDEPLFSYGNNIFDTSYISYSPSYLWGIYQLVSEDFILQFDGEKSVGFFDVKNDIALRNNLVNKQPEEVALYEQKLKAVLHSYTTRVRGNLLYVK